MLCPHMRFGSLTDIDLLLDRLRDRVGILVVDTLHQVHVLRIASRAAPHFFFLPSTNQL